MRSDSFLFWGIRLINQSNHSVGLMAGDNLKATVEPTCLRYRYLLAEYTPDRKCTGQGGLDGSYCRLG